MKAKIIQGCMRIDHLSDDELYELIKTDIANGIDYFDHADIYGGDGLCEKRFGHVLELHPELRAKMILQTKCGIVVDPEGNYYDSSKQHILDSVNRSLKNLHTSYIDYLLIHRPDALMDLSEISQALNELYATGKVVHFGVSNFNKQQIKYLSKGISYIVEVNQLQFSLCHSQLIDGEFLTNTTFDDARFVDDELMYYCKANSIYVQAWSPFQYGFFEGVYIDSPKYPELNKELEILANKYNCTKNAIAVAWILNYAPNMQVVSGSTNLKRMKDIAKAAEIKLTKKEWYKLYRSAGHVLP